MLTKSYKVNQIDNHTIPSVYIITAVSELVLA